MGGYTRSSVTGSAECTLSSLHKPLSLIIDVKVIEQNRMAKFKLIINACFQLINGTDSQPLNRRRPAFFRAASIVY